MRDYGITRKKLAPQERQKRISEGLRASWRRRSRKKQQQEKNPMYRPDWFTKVANGRNVLTIALDVHMAVTGSADCRPEDAAEDAKALKWVVENWIASRCEFDTHVLNVITEALVEFANSEQPV